MDIARESEEEKARAVVDQQPLRSSGARRPETSDDYDGYDEDDDDEDVKI